MSIRQEVEVEKSDFTPRNEIVPGRFNIILEFRAMVPSDSYVFVGGMIKELGTWFSTLQMRIDEHVKKLKPIDEESIKKTFSDFIQTSRPTESTQFLRYGQTYAIPGSSLKGAIRSRIEYKLKPFKVGGGYRSYSCYVVQEAFSRPAKNHINFWGEDVTYARATCSPPKVCAVCDLFGCPSLSSRIHFSDAIMTAGQVKYVSEVRREAALPNSEFKTNVSIFNSDLLDLGLLFLGMEIFTLSPALIGAFKYRFNKKLGQDKLGNRYFAGLLKFELQSFKPLLGDFPSEITDNFALIDKARDRLFEKYGNYVDIQRGVLS
ncbi:MAG: RAMP superfamily CRISPR-associated protein [Candidatus Aenigmatarchaeota archaeon]